jgi:hypothetical protein
VIVANVLIQLLEIFNHLHTFVLSGGVGTSDTFVVFLSYCTAGGMVGRHAVMMSSALRLAVWKLKKVYLARKFSGLENAVSLLAPSRKKL